MMSQSLQSLRRILLLMTIALVMWSASNPLIPEADTTESRLWTFDTDAPGTLPSDFVVGTLFDGRPAGDWQVVQAGSSLVLAQLMGKGAEHAYKVVLLNGSKSSNLTLEVSLLALDGKADMGGGLIWRATDDRNYYLTRANPLEQNVRIYRVVKGVRQMLNNFDQIIDVRKWHTLRVMTKGCRVLVFFDDKQVFDLCDEMFKNGRIGLWTKSDAITYFDDLKLEITP